MARVDAAERDDARPEPAPVGALARPSPRSRTCPRVLGDAENLPVRRRQLRPLRLRGLDRVLAGPAARASPRPTAWCAPAAPRWSSARSARPTASPARWPRPGCCSRPSRSTRAGWRPRASRTCASRELAPDWYRDQRAPYALAVSGVKPAPGPSPAARARRGRRSRPRAALRFAAPLRRRLGRGRRRSSRSPPC